MREVRERSEFAFAGTIPMSKLVKANRCVVDRYVSARVPPAIYVDT